MEHWKRWAALALSLGAAAVLLGGCMGGESQSAFTSAALESEVISSPARQTEEPEETPAQSAPPAPGETTGTGGAPEIDSGGSGGEQTTAGESVLDEDGTYSDVEDVALYLHTYGELPDNFITKSEARELGWTGGGLEDYAPGMCIGGDTFGNREGLLPEGNYHECDIGTLGQDSRGARRIVWDEDGNIYYTKDHYESFELLYTGN